jgi:hypothetical protein
MAKQIARLLKTDVMADIDLPAIAQFLQSQGRKGDSILAHINPKEAALLQDLGGASTPNPVTGLPEFYDPYASYDKPYSYGKTQRDIVDTITAPEQQIVRAPRAELYAETMPNYSAPRYTDFKIEPDRDIFAEKTRGTTITPDYLSSYNIAGDGGFGERPVDYFSTPSAKERFDIPGVDLIKGAPTLPDVESVQTPTVVDDRNILRRGVDSLKEMTGLSGSELARLGLAGGLGLQGALAARDLKRQGEESRREQEAIAAPYRERGAALLAQAEQGELTPQGQQSLQAMRARLAQGAESRGGVGAQQAQAQIESYRQQLLANQYDYGMKISNVGDQLMMGAIRTGLEADRYATQMTNNYYTNMARLLVSIGADENDIKNITQSNNVGSQ